MIDSMCFLNKERYHMLFVLSLLIFMLRKMRRITFLLREGGRNMERNVHIFFFTQFVNSSGTYLLLVAQAPRFECFQIK